ncbi:hypothetical protein ABGB07_15485 [Micromonosporaceae bacterium B7E4]
MKKVRWASTIALTAALLISLTPTAASAASREVRNTGAYAIGAIQVFDGQYSQGAYDALIPPNRFSGWASTAGIYVGPGYCVRARKWLAGTEAFPPAPSQLDNPFIVHGPAYVELFSSIGFDVRALPLSDPLCWNPSPVAESGPFRVHY